MVVKLIRNGLGFLIAGLDVLTRGKPMQRSSEIQQAVDEVVKRELSLYQFYACPFCIKTRRAIARLNLPMVYRDAQAEGEHREALLKQGGRVKVPCLRIEDAQGVKWMYESSEIIAYLEARFGEPAEVAVKSS